MFFFLLVKQSKRKLSGVSNFAKKKALTQISSSYYYSSTPSNLKDSSKGRGVGSGGGGGGGAYLLFFFLPYLWKHGILRRLITVTTTFFNILTNKIWEALLRRPLCH